MIDAFLKLDTLAGESTDEGHVGWIEILSFSQGVSQSVSGSVSGTGARSAERCDHSDMSIMKQMDATTPDLLLKCSNGDHLDTATLQLHRATANKQLYMEWAMEDVLITSVQASGSQGGGFPMESVSLNYAKVTWTYHKTDPETGDDKGVVAKWWDLKLNKGG